MLSADISNGSRNSMNDSHLFMYGEIHPGFWWVTYWLTRHTVQHRSPQSVAGHWMWLVSDCVWVERLQVSRCRTFLESCPPQQLMIYNAHPKVGSPQTQLRSPPVHSDFRTCIVSVPLRTQLRWSLALIEPHCALARDCCVPCGVCHGMHTGHTQATFSDLPHSGLTYVELCLASQYVTHPGSGWISPYISENGIWSSEYYWKCLMIALNLLLWYELPLGGKLRNN